MPTNVISMDNLFKIINDFAVYLLIAIVGFFTWFFKNIFSEHKKMFDYYNRNKTTDMGKIISEIELLKYEIKKVEGESKKYWLDHKNQMEANQKILIEKLSSYSRSSEQQTELIKQMFNSLEGRFERLEDRVNR